MSGKWSRGAILSRLTAPIAKVARAVKRRAKGDEDGDEVKRLMEMALGQSKSSSSSDGLTDDAFRMTTKQMLSEGAGAFQVKLHVISLVEFREGVGDKWARLADKVMLIAEGVINMHIGAGNIFGRQGTDFFVLLFRNVDNNEGRRRSIIIAQELGTRLVGDQFEGNERPLALAAEVSLADGLNPDGSINTDAIHGAVGEMRAVIASHLKDGRPLPSWMRPGTLGQDEGGLRRHLQPSVLGAANAAMDDDRPPILLGAEPGAKAPLKDPNWKPLKAKPKAPPQEPSWQTLSVGGAKALPPELDDGDPSAEKLPPDARLALIWRPTWMAAGEAIGAYKAQIMRMDKPGSTIMESALAYARDDDSGTHTLDRFCIASAIRDFQASETAANGCTIIIPIHWATLSAENRMEFLAPFADLTKPSRGSRVVIELFGVPADVKPMILGTVIQSARSLCRDVALRTRLASPRAAMALDCGASMIGLDLAELAQPDRVDDDHLLDAMKDYHATAAKARIGAYVWGARKRKVLVGAVQAGFAMVNGTALMKDIPKPAKVLPAPKARFVAP